MGYVFASPGQAVVPVVGTTDLFPVRRIYCVGRNYADHAREMGASEREAPFFFAKPADALFLIADGALARLPYPTETGDLQYEIELVVAIGAHGSAVPASRTGPMVWGYAVGVDLTRRDLQSMMKKQGRPWEISKSFDRSAPLSPIRPAQACGPMESGRIWLDVNGQRRQDGDIARMIWSVSEIIEHLSRYFSLAPGDLVFTGTPAGVAPIRPGDVIKGGVDRVGSIAFELTAAAA